MSIFIYRMQSILNLKYKMEEQAKLDFAAAKMKLDAEEEKLTILYNRKGEYEEEGVRLRESKLKVRDIIDNKNALMQMDDYIKAQKFQVKKAENDLEMERQKLTEVMQERKMQEKLRENAFESFMKEENAKESKEIDELTSYTYGQKRR